MSGDPLETGHDDDEEWLDCEHELCANLQWGLMCKRLRDQGINFPNYRQEQQQEGQ